MRPEPSVSGPQTAKLAWQVSTLRGKYGYSRLAAADQDLVFVCQCSNIQVPNCWKISARETGGGAVRWSTTLPFSPAGAGVPNVVGVSGSRVFVTRGTEGVRDHLYALDTASGALVWTSEDLVGYWKSDVLSFTPDGDLIAENLFPFPVQIRIRASDGTTVWRTDYPCEAQGCGVAVSGSRGYLWNWGFSDAGLGIAVSAIDLDTGGLLYTGPVLVPLGLSMWAARPVVARTGVVCVEFTTGDGESFIAGLADDGASLVEKWRLTAAFLAYAIPATGADGAVYSFSRERAAMKVDSASGKVVARSREGLWLEDSFYAAAESVVDSRGGVFISVPQLTFKTKADGSGSLFPRPGAVIALRPDLSIAWMDSTITSPLEGFSNLVLTANGTLVVPGEGTGVLLRAYRDPAPATAPPGLSVPVPAVVSGR